MMGKDGMRCRRRGVGGIEHGMMRMWRSSTTSLPFTCQKPLSFCHSSLKILMVVLMIMITLLCSSECCAGNKNQVEQPHGAAAPCLVGVAPTPGALFANYPPNVRLFNVYASVPIDAEDSKRLIADFHAAARRRNATLMVTVELAHGQQLDDAVATGTLASAFGAIAKLCQDFSKRGLTGGCIIRPLPEMNGSWFTWGRQPSLAKQAFQQLSAVRNDATKVLWAPNYGAGYPFNDKGSQDATSLEQLDVNGDGVLDAQDDPYAPYFPGPEHCDFVGLSLYSYPPWPWSDPVRMHDNKLAPWLGVEARPNAMQDKIFGQYPGEMHVPNFWDAYVLRYDKPFVLAETASFFVAPEHSPTGGFRGMHFVKNASDVVLSAELAIKSSWWRQVFNASFCEEHAGKVHAMVWFDVAKAEWEVSPRVVDWRAWYGGALQQQSGEEPQGVVEHQKSSFAGSKLERSLYTPLSGSALERAREVSTALRAHVAQSWPPP